MVKNKIVECTAIVVYCNLALSICFSVTSAMACFEVISLDKTLEELKIWMAVSSSRMLPSEVLSTSRILSSISFKRLYRRINATTGAILKNTVYFRHLAELTDSFPLLNQVALLPQ